MLIFIAIWNKPNNKACTNHTKKKLDCPKKGNELHIMKSEEMFNEFPLNKKYVN
jgi:hypothetical protein